MGTYDFRYLLDVFQIFDVFLPTLLMNRYFIREYELARKSLRLLGQLFYDLWEI